MPKHLQCPSRQGTLTAVAILAATAWAAGAAPAQAQTVEGSFERTLRVSGPVDLDIRTGSGRIEVRTGENDRVHVIGRIRARSSWRSRSDAADKVRQLEASPPIEQDGNRVRIGHIENAELRENVSISYELVVPPETQLRSRTGSGSQVIQGVGGPVDASTGSGGVTVRDAGAPVQVSSGSGSLEIRSVRGAVEAKTGSGSIRASGIAGAFTARTGSGSVQLEQTAPGDVELSSGSGRLTIEGVRGALRASASSGSIRARGIPTGDWRLSAGSGSVTVEMTEEIGFELDARTSSGRVHSQHPVTVVGTLSRRELRGTVRGGGPRVEIRTGSGSIRVD